MMRGSRPSGPVTWLAIAMVPLVAWWLWSAESQRSGEESPARQELAWLDEDGTIVARVPDSAADYAGIWLMRDERNAVAAVQTSGGRLRLWQLDLETGARARMEDPTAASIPGGTSRLTHWSPSRLVFDVPTADRGLDIWLIPREAPGDAVPYLDSVWPERQGQLSFEQRWMAYVSEEMGVPEVYVRTFPDPDGGRWLISLPDGGERPVWRADSLMIYYWAPGGRLVAVPLKRGTQFVLPGNPHVWMTTPVSSPVPYAVTRNGRRVLMAVLLTDP